LHRRGLQTLLTDSRLQSLKMIRRSALLVALLFTPLCGFSQTGGVTLPPGTPFPVQIDGTLPMRVGTPIRARLLYPVYSGETLLIPEKAVLLGSIVALRPDRSRRLHARLNADFTPFHTPVVRFTQVMLADGTALPLVSGNASNGAPIFRLVAPPPRKGGFIRQQIEQGKQLARDQIAVFTAPGKKDRLIQLLYHQLPYHPERIEKGTAWTIETTEPLSIAHQALPPPPAAPAIAAAPAGEGPPTWMIQAYLNDDLSSATTKDGQAIKATVAEPIYNPDHTLAVPQGATLLGAVTKSKRARMFGRAGVLSFSFRQLALPEGDTQSVQTSLTGADSASSANLAMNSEGEVKPKPRDKIVIPLILLTLAGGPLDREGNDGALRKNALASNSLGLAGFLIGTIAQKPNLSAGIGYYGAAISIYDRLIAKGKEVAFTRDTRIIVQTTARRSSAIKPDASTSRTR